MLLVIALAPGVMLSVSAIEAENLCRHCDADTNSAIAHLN
jgi:hypothetical protein